MEREAKYEMVNPEPEDSKCGGTSQRDSLSYSDTYVMGGEMMNSVWGMLSVKCLLASPVEMFSEQLDFLSKTI